MGKWIQCDFKKVKETFSELWYFCFTFSKKYAGGSVHFKIEMVLSYQPIVFNFTVVLALRFCSCTKNYIKATIPFLCVDVNTLHLGEPVFCQGQILPSNFTFDDNSSPRINIVLCGIPQPTVEGEFIGQKVNILNKTIDSYTHNYTLQLPRLTQTSCGKELTVRTIGCNGIIANKTKVFVENCKYDTKSMLFLLWIFFNNFFLEIFHVNKRSFPN